MLLDFPVTAPWQHVLLPKNRLFLTHGHLYHPDNLPPLNTDDVLVYGHTHIPVAEKRGDLYYFNPGSVSLPKGGYPASYGCCRRAPYRFFRCKAGNLLHK